MEVMTLDEAIQHAEEVAEENENLWRICPESESVFFLCDGSKDCTALTNGKDKGCLKCAVEHHRLAEWLKDYKRLLEQELCGDAISRKEAIRIAIGFCHPANVAKELAKLPSVNVTDTNVGKIEKEESK